MELTHRKRFDTVGQFGIPVQQYQSNYGNLFYQDRSLIDKETLLRYILNYVMGRQNFSSQISSSLYLSNINALPQLDSYINIIAKQISVSQFQDNNFYLQNLNLVCNIQKSEALSVLTESTVYHSVNSKIKALSNNCDDKSNYRNSKFQQNDSKILNYSSSNNKKRQAPDYDNYEIKATKRIKSETKSPDFADDSDTATDICNTNLSEQNVDPKLNSFNIVTKKWNVKQIADPHIDYTYHLIPNLNCNYSYSRSTSQRNVSCLIIFDKQIKDLDTYINNVDDNINNLYKQYSQCDNFKEMCKVNDKIKNLESRVYVLKNKYAALCEARDEIFQLYVGRRKSLHFNTKYITNYELEANKKTRDMLDSYEQIYGTY